MQDGIRVYGSAEYHNVFLLMPAFAVIGLMASFRVRETYCRNITVDLPVKA